MKKLLAVVATAVLGLGLAVGAVAAPASAHDVSKDFTCNSLTINLTNYNGGVTNRVTFTVDGNRVVDDTFGDHYSKTYSLSPTNVSHSYDIKVTAGDGGGQWDHHYTGSTTGCETPISVTTAPSATQPTCTTDGHLVIPTQTGVVFSGGANGDGPGSYTISASAAPGYTLTGNPGPWPITVQSKLTDSSCDITVPTPVEPTATDQTCNADQTAAISGSITVTAETGVTYTIHNTADADAANDITVTDGKTDVAPGTYLVTATADAGYRLDAPFSETLTVNPALCEPTLADFTASASFVQPVCSAGDTTPSGYVEIDTTQAPFVTYTLNGTQTLTSEKTNLPAGDYTVVATVPAGDTIDGDSTFTGTIKAADAVCGDLKTLAFTGPGAYAPYLAIAALLLGAGGFLITRSRLVRKNAAK